MPLCAPHRGVAYPRCMAILVTGGAGFIGSAFVHAWCARTDEELVNLDLLTYAGNMDNLADLPAQGRHTFVHGDICDRELVGRLLATHAPRAVVHLAAESHVDRSIKGADAFIRTNVGGTCALLDEATAYWRALPGGDQSRFRFLHVSTDEVFGTLGPSDAPFTEHSAFKPNSPYAASKASADHLVRAWHVTHGLPVLTTNCSNNYGLRQFPEKLIPLCIARALAGEPLPIYGDGQQVRDWLHVDDHCDALRLVLERGRVGATYLVGGHGETANLDLVHALCGVLDEARPGGAPHAALIRFVADRPGHDRRYAIDPSLLRDELGWRPRRSLADGLRQTVRWYLDNGAWLERVRSGAYREWVAEHYGA